MKKIVLLFLSVSTFCIQNSKAGGFKIALQGQKQTGMAGTGVGFAQDAATIYYNPAGMSFTTNQVNLGMSFLFPQTSFLEKGTNTIYNSVNQMFTPFSLYADCSLSKAIKLGLGVYTPFGTGVKYPSNWSGRYTLDEIELKTIFYQPTLSLKLGNNFSLGAGFIYATGDVMLRKDLPITSGTNYDVANAQLDGSGKGFGFNVGAYLKASDRFNLGATYHSKVTMKVDEGDAIFSNIPVALASTFPTHNTFKTDLALPSEIAVGLSYKITNELTIAIDFNHTMWKSFDSLGFDYALNTSAVSDKKSPRLYENASCIRFGAQLEASKHVNLRAGLFFDQTPVQDGYVAPELPDNNKVGLSAGATFKLDERFQLDLSLLYENVAAREQRNKETGLDGTFQTEVIAPGVGITYLFQKRTTKRKNY